MASTGTAGDPLTALPPLPPRYTPIGEVGEGATGTVWRAHDRELDRDVAFKIVRRNLAIHARFRARFAREVAISASISHPHVVPVHDHGRLPDGRPFVALAYANQGSLSDLLRRKPPLRVALKVLDQVLDALSEMHARGIVHQDLKPENVLLHGDPEDPDAWVADLGAAGALTELAMDHRGISGTPRWMAPEQLMGQAHELGPWTDLYAVGLLLGEVLGAERLGTPSRKQLLERRLTDPSGCRIGCRCPWPSWSGPSSTPSLDSATTAPPMCVGPCVGPPWTSTPTSG